MEPPNKIIHRRDLTDYTGVELTLSTVTRTSAYYVKFKGSCSVVAYIPLAQLGRVYQGTHAEFFTNHNRLRKSVRATLDSMLSHITKLENEAVEIEKEGK